MARRTWYRLDNIGKFYSSQAGRSSQTVFRYSAELEDDIAPDILQHALDHAIAQFPSFNVHLLNGMFWHYLEQSDGRPLVEPEHLPICSRLHYGPKSMLFRVSYFRNRVNLEVSHIISDGRGAINLFKSLLHAYIAERYDVPGVPSDYDGSDSDKAENSFDKYYEKDKAGAAPGTKIYRLSGPIDRDAPTFMEYHVSASKVLGAAHQCGVSLTSYLIAAILCAIRDVMPSRARNRAIRVDIPVDLRAFFRSETVRNFYGMTYVAYTPADIEADEDSAKTSATSPDVTGDGQQSAARTAHGNGMGGLLTDEPLADIARHVQEQLGHATSRERVESHMNRMIALEKNPALRLAPSPAKDWVLELARFIADRETTTTVSNLGRVTLDERLARHVRSVSFLTTPASLNFTVCSFGDDLSIGVSTVYHDLNVIKNLCRILAAQGISGRMNIAGAHVRKERRHEALRCLQRRFHRRYGPLPALSERIARRGLSRRIPRAADLSASEASDGGDHHVCNRRDPVAARVLRLSVVVADTDCQCIGSRSDHQRAVHQQCDSARATAASTHVSIFLYHAGDCAGLVCRDDESCRHHVRHTDHVSGFAGL